MRFPSMHNLRRVDSESTDDDSGISCVDGQRKRRIISASVYVVACAFFASLNHVLVGYDVGVTSGAIIFIQEDLKISEVQVEVLVGCLSIVSLVGSLVGGRTSDAVGRRWTMVLAASVFQVGAVMMTTAPSFELLLVGRILAGVGIGFGSVVAPIYIAEISPTVDRGCLTSFPEIFINLGILLGYVSNYLFSGLPSDISWRIMLAVGTFPSILVALALFIIPESPRWLIMQNRMHEARTVLLQTTDSEEEADERMEEIQVAVVPADTEKFEQRSVWCELICPSCAVGQMLLVGVGIQCFQQITGTDATVYYSPEIFREAGIQDNSSLLGATVAIGTTKTLFVFVAILLIDKLGRKPLLYVSTIGMTICTFGLGTSLRYHAQWSSPWFSPAFLFACLNIAFFSVGMGPVCGVLTSEIYPQRLRARAAALGVVGNRMCSGLVSMCFLSISRVISTGGTFLVFSAISALSIVFVHTVVPETKGKSLEQIELLFRHEHQSKASTTQNGNGDHLLPK